MRSSEDINIINRLFLFSAGVSTDLISKCPRFEVIKYSSIGVTIIFTAILAVFSSFYAFSLLFDNQLVSMFFALFWGAIIFNLDRFIVSTMRASDNKWSEFIKAIPRFFLAIMIALIISKPLEIKLFNNEIVAHLTQKRVNDLNEINRRYEAGLIGLDAQKEKIEDEYSRKMKLREKYYQDYICECDGTCGTAKKGRGIECFTKQSKYESYVEELKIERKRIDLLLSKIEEKETLTYSTIAKEREMLEAKSPFGLLSQLKALNDIDKFSSIFIVLIFVLVETAPLLTKLISPKGPYDNLVMEYEKEYEISYLKSIDNLDQERLKNKKLQEISSRYEIKTKETEIQNSAKKEALKRYEDLKAELQQKISKN